MSLRKRAEQSNSSVEDLLKVSYEKERLRQKRIRAKRLQKDQEQIAVTEGGRSCSSSERSQRVRRNEDGGIGVYASAASRLDNLLN